LINKAEIGDFLYIIIFAILMLLGGLEKVMKAKRQQNMPPPPPQPYDDFEDAEEQSSSEQSPPKTLEEIMRRMMQTVETPAGQEIKSFYPEEVQSNEVIPETSFFNYQPIVVQNTDQSEYKAYIEEGNEVNTYHDFEFDIRQAVIASEILNRKY